MRSAAKSESGPEAGVAVAVDPVDGVADAAGETVIEPVGVGGPGDGERLAASAKVDRLTPQMSGVATVALRWQPVASSNAGAGAFRRAAGAGPHTYRIVLEYVAPATVDGQASPLLYVAPTMRPDEALTSQPEKLPRLAMTGASGDALALTLALPEALPLELALAPGDKLALALAVAEALKPGLALALAEAEAVAAAASVPATPEMTAVTATSGLTLRL